MMNPRKTIWFPAKTCGLGWGPPTCWQGWLVILSYVLSLLAGSLLFLSSHPRIDCFIAWTIGWTIVLFVICRLKGEPLRWR